MSKGNDIGERKKEISGRGEARKKKTQIDEGIGGGKETKDGKRKFEKVSFQRSLRK